MTSQATITRERSQEGVGWKRRIGFYVAGGLFLLVSLAFFGLMAGILAHLFTGWFSAAELGVHQLHETLGSALFWSLIAGMAFTVVRPAQMISALRQTLFMLAAFLLLLLASFSESLMGPLVMMSILFVLTAVTAVLHPTRHALLRVREGFNPGLLALTIIAAIPLLPYALNQLQIQIGASPGDPHAEVGHWMIMSAYGVAIVLYGLLASLRSSGWRVPAWSAGILAVLFGLASLLLPTQASAVGPTWGTVAVAWGVLFVAAAEWTAVARR
ncbi:MAG: hypothetical protein R3248_05185 [Candidatus Promineifilaceae bacterium]|nr:hypothetical protein [Candidatus Promineifilaceae bacterium]